MTDDMAETTIANLRFLTFSLFMSSAAFLNDSGSLRMEPPSFKTRLFSAFDRESVPTFGYLEGVFPVDSDVGL
ncbi:MAG: hypothetical protein GTN80_05170 [Nitrososphaeria archaeon]|nr:hypothetical protein [Nitrososphaeria archaeon]NIQ33016.1 hypothetical protein [Nitrososphaeria archaeon]